MTGISTGRVCTSTKIRSRSRRTRSWRSRRTTTTRPITGGTRTIRRSRCRGASRPRMRCASPSSASPSTPRTWPRVPRSIPTAYSGKCSNFSHCHPEPPEPRRAKRRAAEDGRRTPFGKMRDAERGKYVGGPSTVLRCFGFAYAAPAAQDDRFGRTLLSIPMPSDRESVLRFDLAVQKSHPLVYTAAFLTALAGHALGVFVLNFRATLAVWFISLACAAAMYALFRRGIARKILNPIWIGTDILLVTLGVYATGGSPSPWFIWYLATSASTAFAVGKRASYIVSIVNAIAYGGVLMAMGQASFGNDVMLLALARMLFLFGASFFFLAGIANLQQK